MHFRVYDGAEATTPLWKIDDQEVTVNADGSFVHAFGDETLAALIATGRVTHVGLAIGTSASLATELKPRRHGDGASLHRQSSVAATESPPQLL